MSYPQRSLALLVLVLSLGQASLRLSPVSAADDVNFNRDIKPILFSHCVACHGPDEETREAGLRLDTQAGSREDRGGYQPIVPGDASASELYLRASSEDPDYRMPPADFGKPLDDKQIDLLRRWIDAGGDFDAHWSYAPIRRPALPRVRDGAWPRNPVDVFVLHHLEQAGLSPSPSAPPHQIARRLALDLTGLPPGPQFAEWASSAAPDDAQRYAQEVSRHIDSLLADPAAGERWAAVWLDLVRYADSAGYADDPPRTIWAYRDYVIDAFARNKPFDQFTVEQIAGDLLPEPTAEQLVATAMHRNTPTNNEGGTDDEEFRNSAVIDRVNTTMSVWMGTTMACAQCHTHKYDPITQEEYFRFFAIFNNSADNDQKNEAPTIDLYSRDQQQRREKLLRKLEEVRRLTDASAEPLDWSLQREFESWQRRASEDLQQPQLARFVRVDIPDREQFLSLAEVQVFAGQQNVALAGTASQSSTAFGGPAARAVDGKTDGHYEDAASTTHTRQEKSPWWQVELDRDYAVERVVVWNRTDGDLQNRLEGYRVQLLDAERNVVWQTAPEQVPAPSIDLAVQPDPHFVAALLASHDARTPQQLASLRQSFLGERTQRLENQLAEIKPHTTVPVMAELPADKQRSTHVQIRGSFLDLGQQVVPGVPAAFHPLQADAEPTRLDVARWLVDRQNPLTARVVVNRIWEQLFGAGLVETSEEFGSQGELPTHPELLDWLAMELIESGWDRQHVIRTIVSSATYQQTSLVSREKFDRDPENRLLARGPRFRISAEAVRDSALALSGLLARDMFGPPVQPPRPSLGLKAAFGGSTDWTNSTGADRYRRGVYTEWRRSMPYPSMATFDVPNREVCTIRRIRTNTPLQALVTLNDPVYVEAARALGQRIVARKAASDRERAEWALQHVLLRSPSAAEVDQLMGVYEQAANHYRAAPDDAAKLLAGEPLAAIGAEPSPELAAWTVVSNVLLNLDELLQKP